MHRRWILPVPPGDPAPARELAHAFRLPPFVADLLAAKGLVEEDRVAEFLNPRLRRLHDPNLLPEMAAATARIEDALRANQRIVLYGDYDVDGVTSLAILHRVIHAYGGRVDSFLPLRAEEGYGLSPAGIERCIDLHQPDLLIAIDCGTNSATEANILRQRGIDLVILDHHEPDGPRPHCVARVNPKCADTGFDYLCSAGIAFKTAHALLKRTAIPGFELKTLLDLVALATLCDLVPLDGENRTLVRHGLRQMERTEWPGLAALMAVASVRPPVRSSDVGFRLGPRINASGRLGTAQDSLQLLLTSDPLEAQQLAASLETHNRDRQAVERNVVLEVENWLEENFDPDRDKTIVAGRRDWHTGVLGIVASRVMRRHHRPTLIVGFDGSGAGKGSGRSVAGLSLVAALGLCSDHLGTFGGHEMAAGLHVHEDQFEEFRTAFEAAARSLLGSAPLVPTLRLHAELPLDDFGEDFLESQAMLEPFGTANPQPALLVRHVTPSAPPRVLKEKHLRFDLPAGNGSLAAIFFNGATDSLPSPPWDIAFHLERNEWNGRVSAQMQVIDIRAAA
ncbi:MAG: single-stranded-DNA-specific exonuclease RecJ [Chthoniobacterales bacterium]